MKEPVFLGVVDQKRHIYIPWRGTTVPTTIPDERGYENGQILLVTLENSEPFSRLSKVKPPTLKETKRMKDELNADWSRFTQQFEIANIAQKVVMLKKLDDATKQMSSMF